MTKQIGAITMMRRFSIALFALLVTALPALSATAPLTLLLSAATTTGAGSSASFHNYPRTSFVCGVAGTGTVTATVNVEVSQDTVNWYTLATFTLSGTTSASSSTTAISAYPYVRGNVTALTGTSAAVTLSMYPQ